MNLDTVAIPEPFLSALKEGKPLSVVDHPVTKPEERFGRGLARTLVGREKEGREDFETALPALGDACRVELALLDIRQRDGLKKAFSIADEISSKAPQGSPLKARAHHIAGLAIGKQRKSGPAVDHLLKSLEIYRSLGDRQGKAHVYDTLGMVESARGKLEYATQYYALSLVEKSMSGDRVGMAITLGNVGRLHLKTDRIADALEFLRCDLELVDQIGDERGRARVLEDLGRAYLAIRDAASAEREFLRCLEIAQRGNFRDLSFFAHKDMAFVRILQKRFSDAAAELEAARGLLPTEGEEYLRAVLEAARGELLLAEGDRAAVEVLDAAVRSFQDADLPDFELPARVALARALLQQRLPARAERCLLRGISLARAEGFIRHLGALEKAMAELELVEGIIDETGRSLGEGSASTTGRYLLRERLGEGEFGEAFRAYDPERSCEVVVKRLHLDRLYDSPKRERLIRSARAELEAASRIRHPGIAQVHALGREPAGSIYVVQEYVPGVPLRRTMDQTPRSDLGTVLVTGEKIAMALQTLHQAGVVHRDLKPANILIRADGSPVLIDFGIAHIVGERLTDIAGTPEYMAPEQARGKEIDGLADLYSLGVILFEWLAGVRPLRLRGDTFAEQCSDLVKRPAPKLREFRPEVGVELETLIGRLLEKDPRKRPSSAEAVALQCRKLMG